MRERPISELAEINPTLTVHLTDATTVSVVTMADVSESGRLLSHRPRPFGEVKAGLTRFQNGDVLFAKITPCMENGKGAVAQGLENGVGCGSTEFYVLRVRGENDARYLYQWLQWKATRQKAKLFMSGSAGQQRVPADFFRKFEIPAPAPVAQKRIASVLASIDTAIEKTEALIAKHQQIKAGLMHDLFTRGVLLNGQLRPPRSEAPELYQETAIGWIPIDWQLSTLRECLTDSPTNGIYKPAAQIGEGLLMVGQTAFTDQRSIDFTLCRRGAVDKVEAHRHGLTQDDILVTRVFATVEGVGLPTLVPELVEPAVFESNMMRLRIDTSIVKPRLLFEWLQAPIARRHITGGANASNQCSVNQGVLNPLPVALPPLDEQTKITARIELADRQREAIIKSLSKLKLQKLGLMQDLLTGRVSVEHLVPESADA